MLHSSAIDKHKYTFLWLNSQVPKKAPEVIL